MTKIILTAAAISLCHAPYPHGNKRPGDIFFKHHATSYILNNESNYGEALNSRTDLATGAHKEVSSVSGKPLETNVVALGADNTAVRDSTVAINAALSAGATNLFFPAGTYKICGVTIPSIPHLMIHGEGTASKLVQGDCGSPAIQWESDGIPKYPEQTIRDLYFDGSAGKAHTINTSGTGGLTLKNLYFNNVPTGHDSIYVNGSAGKAEHDTRIINVQFYSPAGGTAGNAMIEFGPLAVDSMVSHAIGNGAFVVKYGLKIAEKATTNTITNNHLYNVTENSLAVMGCSNCQFSGNTWDNARGDVAQISANGSTFVGEQYESTNPNRNALTLINASGNIWHATIWGTAGSGSGLVVKETGSSKNNIFLGGNLNALANWSKPYFSFIDTQSYALSVPGYTPLGVRFGFSGSTISNQLQNTLQYLGDKGAKPSISETTYVSPYASSVTLAVIQASTTPESGQEFKFSLIDHTTSTALGSCSITNGNYSCSINSLEKIKAGDQIIIKSEFSVKSGGSMLQYYVNMLG